MMRSLKRILGGLALLIAVLLAVMLVNTLRKSAPLPVAAPAITAPTIDATAAANHLSEAIRFPTVSHEDAKDDQPGAFDGFKAFLERTYPKVYASLDHEMINGRALLFTWKGRDASARPVLFAAHMDVVPVEPGTDGKWAHPPFDGAIADGFVWGRGAMDDKAALIALFEAAETLLGQGFQPARTTYFAFGGDEEVGGNAGARVVAETLGSRGIKLESVLDEGAAVTDGIIPGIKGPVALIGVGEKGYVSIELSVTLPAGHSSMPPAHTSIGVLSEAVARVEAHQMPVRLAPVVREEVQALGLHMSFLPRLALSNLWLLEPLVTRGFAHQRPGNALMRTTTAPTILEAGVKDNVLPSRARAVVNFRVLPGDTTDSVLAHVRDAVADDRVAVSKVPHMINEPPPESPRDSPGYRRLETLVRQFFPEAVVTAPNLVLGATDGRYYARVSDGVYRFAPVIMREDDLPRIHGTDERMGVDALAKMARAYAELVRQ